MAKRPVFIRPSVATDAPSSVGAGVARRLSSNRNCEANWRVSRANLVFAAKLLGCLRAGTSPPPSALEWSGFVEHWTVIIRDDICVLQGTVWRLPLCQESLATPLLAIDPAAGWARALSEWLTIGAPHESTGTAGLRPELISDRAARWLEYQLNPAN
ncbi:hypothetical protein HL667_15075 [Bradyrhizobium sp. 83012]|uniref:Uncharacterized protein n=1 Tax=Bradyrhizobium aeschynomenes TaxID=2734909 RepID=A0ABX2CF78_9BRAD|nr:hypothetical protein [Bradyrhizobium aeschynomenes]NPU66325.1 hypothetical protein [Bradyrhizobium aeschynomenes]